jgi:hypothetical protein
LNEHPQKEEYNFYEVICFVFVDVIYGSHDTPHERFVFIFTRGPGFKLRESTRVIVRGPVKKQKRNEQ